MTGLQRSILCPQLLTASIRVDWFSLPVRSFVDRMPNRGWFRGTPFRSPRVWGRGGGDEGLKGRRGLHPRKASRGLQGGFKAASRELERASPSQTSRGLEAGFKGA